MQETLPEDRMHPLYAMQVLSGDMDPVLAPRYSSLSFFAIRTLLVFCNGKFLQERRTISFSSLLYFKGCGFHSAFTHAQWQCDDVESPLVSASTPVFLIAQRGFAIVLAGSRIGPLAPGLQ